MSDPTLCTRVCRAGWEDHDFFGERMFADFTGKETLGGMLLLSVTGRRPPRALTEFVDDLSTVLGPADPRLWPPKIARLASAYGGIVPGAAVGGLVFDSKDVGPMATPRSASFLAEIEVARAAGTSVEDAVSAYLARHERIAGFGVPFRPHDERLTALRACVERRGLHHGRHWKLLDPVADAVRLARKVEPNVIAGAAAALLDLGLAPEETGIVVFVAFLPCQLANAAEGAAQAPEVLRKIPDEYIAYEGAPPRSSPRAGADSG